MNVAQAVAVVLACSTASVAGAWLYFRRYQVTRAPIGIFNFKDVAILLSTIVLIPFLYLALPVWVAGGLLAVAILSTLYLTFEPGLPRWWMTLAVAVTLISADIGVAFARGNTSALFLVLNNTILVLAVIGAANLWAQSGMRARDAAVLAGGLAVYDVVATWQLTIMTDLLRRLSPIPLVPFVSWSANGAVLGIGLGDLLLISVFPLVIRKAFGRRAGAIAISVVLSVVAVMLVAVGSGLVTRAVPAMAILGPLMVLQYGYWIRKRRTERTTWQYLQVEPIANQARPEL